MLLAESIGISNDVVVAKVVVVEVVVENAVFSWSWYLLGLCLRSVDW